ncbi:MAG: hypothetical protein AABX97_06825 [Candidatus Thermoplasmatota archaeon]
MAAVAIGGLVVGVLWFSALTMIIAINVLNGYYPTDADTYMGLFMGMNFVLAGVAIDIYRREYMPDELIHKLRRPKIVLTRVFR